MLYFNPLKSPIHLKQLGVFFSLLPFRGVKPAVQVHGIQIFQEVSTDPLPACWPLEFQGHFWS